eukprot:1598326-Prymnesium_polylepis.1
MPARRMRGCSVGHLSRPPYIWRVRPVRASPSVSAACRRARLPHARELTRAAPGSWGRQISA